MQMQNGRRHVEAAPPALQISPRAPTRRSKSRAGIRMSLLPTKSPTGADRRPRALHILCQHWCVLRCDLPTFKAIKKDVPPFVP